MSRYGAVALNEVVLHGPRVTLRPWHSDDAPAVHAIIASGALREFLALPDPYTLAQAEDFVSRFAPGERARGSALECAVVASDSGRLVGSATLRLPAGKQAADIGYWIAPEAQGQGYAAEATGVLARWGFDHDIHRIEVQLDVRNVASAATALRAGFGFESVRRDGLAVGDGFRDIAVFVRTAHDPGQPIPPAFAPLPAEGLSDGVLALRAPVLDDACAFAEQEDDPVTRKVVFTAAVRDRSAIERLLARARLDWLVGRTAQLTMVDVVSGRFAGSLHLRVSGPPNVGGLGYVVHPDFRGRGYTTRALRLLAHWAFEQAGFVRLELGAKHGNSASQRAAASAGFKPEGVTAARLRNADGTFSDEVRFGLVNPRYR